MSVKKLSVSLPEESLAQIEWIRQNVLHAPESASFSGLLQMTIGLAYFHYNFQVNELSFNEHGLSVL